MLTPLTIVRGIVGIWENDHHREFWHGLCMCGRDERDVGTRNQEEGVKENVGCSEGGEKRLGSLGSKYASIEEFATKSYIFWVFSKVRNREFYDGEDHVKIEWINEFMRNIFHMYSEILQIVI